MIDELVSLLQPLYTILMILLLGYFVYGITKRNLDHTEFPEDCTVIYKPERTEEDKYMFDHDDPWIQTHRVRVPFTDREPILNTVYETIVSRIRDNNVWINK